MVPLLLKATVLERQGKSEKRDSISYFDFIHFYFKRKHFYVTLSLKSLIDLNEEEDLEGSNKNYKYKTRLTPVLSQPHPHHCH